MRPIAHAAFVAAAVADDVATVEAYCQQRDVRANVAATEAAVTSTSLTQLRPSDVALSDGAVVQRWYISLDADGEQRIVLWEAARAGSANVVEWFFSRDADMGATLAVLLTGTAVHAKNPYVLEIVFSSRAFRERLDAAKAQTLLNVLVRHVQDGSDTAVLIAHGAQLHALPQYVTIVAARSSLDQIDVLAASGAPFGGADILHCAVNRHKGEVVRRLLQYGADSGTRHAGNALVRMALAGDVDMVEVLLREGFVDVDAHGRDERTALMCVFGTLDYELTPAIRVRIVTLLLDFGADVRRSMAEHGQAIHCAVRARQYDVVRVLMERGSSIDEPFPDGTRMIDELMAQSPSDALAALLDYITSAPQE